MTYYRLYFFDAKGHIQRALELDCETDADAVAAARANADGRPMELWDHDRLVWGADAEPPPA